MSLEAERSCRRVRLARALRFPPDWMNFEELLVFSVRCALMLGAYVLARWLGFSA